MILKNYIFKRKHLKTVLTLACIDILSTLIWYTTSDVPEWNPFMSGVLEKSLLLFVVTKLSITFLAIILLSKYIDRLITQVGIGIILLAYSSIAALHYFVFLFLILES